MQLASTNVFQAANWAALIPYRASMAARMCVPRHDQVQLVAVGRETGHGVGGTGGGGRGRGGVCVVLVGLLVLRVRVLVVVLVLRMMVVVDDELLVDAGAVTVPMAQ